MVPEIHDRLRKAREAARYETGTDAAAALGVNQQTYLAHENGSRGIRKDVAARYAKKFGVSVEWLLYGTGTMDRRAVPLPDNASVPLIGYVSAGAAHFMSDGILGEVDAPRGSTSDTVAVEIRGESLGPFFDGWIVYYDNVERPISPGLMGQLCVVGLSDGRTLIKKPRPSKVPGLYHLFSQTEEPVLDVAIEWAARVKVIAPR